MLDPLILQLRNDEFKDDAIDALVALGEPSVEKLIGAFVTRMKMSVSVPFSRWEN